jgi:hypothetical protein
MRIVGLDRGLDLGEVERAVGPVGNGLGLDGTEHRGAARLVAVAVRFLAENDLVAALAVAHQGREVGLGARGEEERRLEAEDLGRARLQAVDRGIVAEDVVPQLGLEHRAAHPGRRARDGIRAQVYDSGHGRKLKPCAARSWPLPPVSLFRMHARRSTKW